MFYRPLEESRTDTVTYDFGVTVSCDATAPAVSMGLACANHWGPDSLIVTESPCMRKNSSQVQN